MARPLIEKWFPVEIISRDSAIEMSFKPQPAYIARCRELGLRCGNEFYDPKIRSIHPWLARRPRSAARALNLAALLTEDRSGDFLYMLGFSREALKEIVSRGYPPLISYLKPRTDPEIFRDRVVIDPMAGGGSIPLESLSLGARTIACDYNPVSFLILRATVEFPARYGSELWRRLVSEAERLIEYARRDLSQYYGGDAEGYIFLRQVRLGSSSTPLQTVVRLSEKACVRIEGGESLEIVGCGESPKARRELIHMWMDQHVALMEGGREDPNSIHRCVAVQTEKGFRAPDEGEFKLLEKAYMDYLGSEKDLPKVPLPRDNEIFLEILRMRRYDMLFNPRQAIAVGRLISYVRRRARELVETEGEFGAALALYLALGIDRVIDFNTVATTWNHSTKTIRDTSGSYYKFRKLRLEGVYAEAIVPHRTLEWVFEPRINRRTAGGICPVVRELAEMLEGRGDLIDVYMCDATELSKHFRGVADIINVDPPYYDQHIYSDFSELFWPFLRHMLEPALELLFGERVLIDWSPSSWRAPRSREVIAREGREGVFEALLTKALGEMHRALKDEGILILWFSHRDLRAWGSLVKALRKAGFYISAAIPLPSEHPTRSITRGGEAGMNRVIVVAAEKKPPESGVEEVLERFKDYLMRAKLYPGEEIPGEEVETLVKAVSETLLKT